VTKRAILQVAMQILREGPAPRARASNFGRPVGGLREDSRRWDWAMKVLQRRPCGARRRRDGKPCQALNEPGSSRCKWHGGLSTGPKTVEGRARSIRNLKQFKQKTTESCQSRP